MHFYDYYNNLFDFSNGYYCLYIFLNIDIKTYGKYDPITYNKHTIIITKIMILYNIINILCF